LICQKSKIYSLIKWNLKKKFEILEIPAEETPDQIKIYHDFNDLTTQQLNDFYNNHGFAFGFDDLQFIQDYFKSEKEILPKPN
jgi:phosphoribosylformylglycinamidine synthase